MPGTTKPPTAISVLVDGGTAGSAEVLAACLREARGAKLVGEKTFGDGTEQQFVPLKNGAAVSITHAQMLSPKGAELEVKGLTPDLPVSYRLLDRSPRRALPLRHSPSAVILHAGTDRTWPDLAHHTISFGAAWKGTFRELTRTGRLMSDPSLLITYLLCYLFACCSPWLVISYGWSSCPTPKPIRSSSPFLESLQIAEKSQMAPQPWHSPKDP